MNIPNVIFQEPLVIKKGGKYTGNYKSTDPAIPAIWIWTSEPVEITGCIIVAAGNGIHFGGGGQFNVHHNSIYGIYPSDTSKMKGRAVYSYQPKSAVIENNYCENTGGGFFLEQTETPATLVRIRYNQVKNIDKRTGANVNGPEHRAGIMLSSVVKVKECEIAWNEIINEAGNSSVEDIINIFNSSGLADSPIKINNNYLDGAFPFPLSADSFSGSGLTVDGDPGKNTLDTVSAYINAYDNQIIRTCNAAANIAAGHDVKFYNNTMVSSGKYPDGTQSYRFWGGCCIFDGSKVGASVFTRNSIKGNTIGYARPGINVPFKDRQDWVVEPNTPSDIAVKAADNTSLPNPITKATEDAELPKWIAKLAANKIKIGNTENTAVVIPEPKPTEKSFMIGEVLKATITAVDDAQKPVSYKVGTITITGDALTGVIKDTADEKSFSLKAINAGTSTLTISLQNLYGETITKTITVTVTPALDRATGILINWQ